MKKEQDSRGSKCISQNRIFTLLQYFRRTYERPRTGVVPVAVGFKVFASCPHSLSRVIRTKWPVICTNRLVFVMETTFFFFCGVGTEFFCLI